MTAAWPEATVVPMLIFESGGPHASALAPSFLSYRQLRQMQVSRAQIDRAVDQGSLVRVRKGRYVAADTHPDLVLSARLGARLDCVSLLRMLGVFVHAEHPFHVQMTRGSSRLPNRPAGMICHWRATSAGAQSLVADLIEALAQSCLCQHPREAIATLDNAWHQGLVDEVGIAEVFARLPAKLQILRKHLERSSEAGTESLVRLMVRALGRDVRVQVQITGVGRVDLLVDGWLIIECDSEAFHSGWSQQKKDRRRDAAASRMGYVTLRLIAEDILYRREWVLETVKVVLSSRPAVSAAHNSSKRSRGRAVGAQKQGMSF